MDWSNVGEWLKTNAGQGATLVGSLLTGNYPAAIAAGSALVASATGTTDPGKALQALQQDPATVIRLQELANQEAQSIRSHLETMTRLTLEDQQSSQHETQETIRSGDNANDNFVRWTRPGMAWVSLVIAAVYVLILSQPDWEILMLILVLPWSYMGLRGADKIVEMIVTRRLGAVSTVVNNVTKK